jgi:prolyl-tRNA editing enzyme YbaK/EbsC (Cys-tRNA(Pro) deacylase)
MHWPTNRFLVGMLGQVVEYLHQHGVAFRLYSDPSPEPLPRVAQPLPGSTLRVETRMLSIGGQPAIACIPQGTTVNLRRLSHELGAEVSEAGPEDLAAPYSTADGPLPPFGGALRALTLVDERVPLASSLAFAAVSTTVLIELPYDEFARLEQPRIASFADSGELPETSTVSEPERKSA